MKRRTRGGLLLALGGLLVISPVVSRADDGMEWKMKPIAGFEAGVAAPTNALERFTNTGGTINPFVGLMFNDYLGLWGHLGFFGLPNETLDPPFQRLGLKHDAPTWFMTYMAGPRLQIPLAEDKVYIWGTIEFGGATGLNGGAINRTSYSYSPGGGIDARLTDQITIGPYARWWWINEQVHGVGAGRVVTGGLALTWNEITPPPPPPPPPPPVAAPPPPPPMKKKIVLRGVNFDFNKADIRPDARPILDEAIRILKQEGDVSIIAAGFTDSIGSAAYNMKLSLRRANSVRNYLVAGGISPSRIEVQGFGKNDPVASNATADGRAQNRRVELRVR